MKKTKAEQFFKDKQGHWAIIQFPNILLAVWIVLLIINSLTHSQPLEQLQSAVLFAWSYLELTQGASYFRRVLGAVILVAVVIGFFV